MSTTGFLGLNPSNPLGSDPRPDLARELRAEEQHCLARPLQSVPTHTGQTALPEHGPRTYGLDQSQSLEEEVF